MIIICLYTANNRETKGSYKMFNKQKQLLKSANKLAYLLFFQYLCTAADYIHMAPTK